MFVAHSISSPLAIIVQGARLVSVGDTRLTGLDQSEVDIITNRRDEIGNIGRTFSDLIVYFKEMAETAGQLARGNMSVKITPQSDRDTLGHAFTQMIAYQQKMAEAASRMAEGDLNVNVSPQSNQDILGNAFSQMITSLRNLVGQIVDTAATVGAASSQLATAADQASQASQQVAATIQQVAMGTTQQTQAVIDATSNTEQMARAADGIAKGAQDQAQSVQSTSALIGEMSQIVEQVGQVARSVGQANAKVTQAARQSVISVEQTTQGMDAIRIRSLTTADKVKEMGNRSKDIGRIVETIDDIADKTDMLALNAAVEAARAGEHGRGFAVVAEQVRKLSEDSKTATRDIADLIERVQESVREAIGAMESTVTEVSNGVQLATDTARSLTEILQATDEAAVMAEQISSATGQLRQKSEGVVIAIESVSTIVEENTAAAEEMAAGAQEVMQAMEGVASVAEENSASAEEVSASSEEMSAQVEEVLSSAQELSLLAEQLRTAVALFRIEEVGLTQADRPGRSTSALYPSASRPRAKTDPILVSQSNGQLDES
jgi:methyl-accepting chemotaxis protein